MLYACSRYRCISPMSIDLYRCCKTHAVGAVYRLTVRGRVLIECRSCELLIFFKNLANFSPFLSRSSHGDSSGGACSGTLAVGDVAQFRKQVGNIRLLIYLLIQLSVYIIVSFYLCFFAESFRERTTFNRPH